MGAGRKGGFQSDRRPVYLDHFLHQTPQREQNWVIVFYDQDTPRAQTVVFPFLADSPVVWGWWFILYIAAYSRIDWLHILPHCPGWVDPGTWELPRHPRCAGYQQGTAWVLADWPTQRQVNVHKLFQLIWWLSLPPLWLGLVTSPFSAIICISLMQFSCYWSHVTVRWKLCFIPDISPVCYLKWS